MPVSNLFLVVTLSLSVFIGQIHPFRFPLGSDYDDIKFGPNFKKSGWIGESFRWPNGTIPYTIDAKFTPYERYVILGGMEQISSQTCITFKEQTDELDFVHVLSGYAGSGCWSYFGRIGGQQVLNLEPSICMWVETVAHEFIHAIGFTHEQSRSDRDDFVDIIWGNIIPGKESNFDKFTVEEVYDFGIPYDYESIMHYGPRAFSANGQATVFPKDGNALIGMNQISAKDILKINAMYKGICPGT